MWIGITEEQAIEYTYHNHYQCYGDEEDYPFLTSQAAPLLLSSNQVLGDQHNW